MAENKKIARVYESADGGAGRVVTYTDGSGWSTVPDEFLDLLIEKAGYRWAASYPEEQG